MYGSTWRVGEFLKQGLKGSRGEYLRQRSRVRSSSGRPDGRLSPCTPRRPRAGRLSCKHQWQGSTREQRAVGEVAGLPRSPSLLGNDHHLAKFVDRAGRIGGFLAGPAAHHSILWVWQEFCRCGVSETSVNVIVDGGLLIGVLFGGAVRRHGIAFWCMAKIQLMGQVSSSERRRRRQQITTEATATIERGGADRPSTALAIPALGIDADTLRAARAQQMRRGPHPFTKADLVALLVRLKGLDVARCSLMTCEDLRLAIRVALYAEEPVPSPAIRPPTPSAPPAYAIEPSPVGGFPEPEPKVAL